MVTDSEIGWTPRQRSASASLAPRATKVPAKARRIHLMTCGRARTCRRIAAQPIPVELDLLIQSCLEKRREDRPQRASDLIVALDALAVELSSPAR